jgi:hypothetical protein
MTCREYSLPRALIPIEKICRARSSPSKVRPQLITRSTAGHTGV